jgi:hypothetical protein
MLRSWATAVYRDHGLFAAFSRLPRFLSMYNVFVVSTNRMIETGILRLLQPLGVIGKRASGAKEKYNREHQTCPREI